MSLQQEFQNAQKPIDDSNRKPHVHFFGILKKHSFAFLAKALFTYLPLIIYIIFNLGDKSQKDQNSFVVYIFLSLGFVFISQVNNPLYAFHTQSVYIHKALKSSVHLLFASKIFFGFCSLAIYGSKSPIFNTSLYAWILFCVSVITLGFSMYFDELRERGINEMRKEIEPYSPSNKEIFQEPKTR